MTGVALVAGPDPGHTLPVVAVAAELARRGHRAVVVTGVAHRDVVVAAGATFVPLPVVSDHGRGDDLGYRLWGLGEEMARPTADALAAVAVDVVVTDTITAAGSFAAELLGLPWIELIPHHFDDPDPAIPPMGMGRRPARTPWRRYDDARLSRLQARSLAAGGRQRDAARARLGIVGAWAPAARLVASLPALEYPRSRWPGNVHLVGPLPWDLPGDPLPLPDGDAPLVVVTDTTASGVSHGLGRRALAALRSRDVRLVVTTPEPYTPWPRGCVVGRGPHGPLFAHADVVVTTGGAGGLGKAFVHGVPVVVVPLQGDQFEAAERVVVAGAGRRLRPWQLGPRGLRHAVLDVLRDPSYTAAARRLQAEAAVLGPARAADVVLAVAAGRAVVGCGPQR